jgi:hypothetical protein
MKFGEVIEVLKQGKSVYRQGWNGKGLFATLQVPDEHSKMTRPYLYLTSPSGSTNQYGDDPREHRVPWIPGITDILAEDWGIME